MTPPASVRYSLVSPPPGPSGAAIAIIQLDADSAEDLDAALAALDIRPVPPGRAALRGLAGIDTGLVARITPGCAQLMPHGGAIIIDSLLGRLGATPGFVLSSDPGLHDPARLYPEAGDLIEACALDAISRAASPLAVEVILRQRDLWRSAPQHSKMLSQDDSRAMNFLLTPPTVVLLGPPNIGKSTLTNTLARRNVSIVADQPGTTRDHVGIALELAGLVVRWIDAPGIDPHAHDAIERAAASLALSAARDADLILLCADRGSSLVDLDALSVPRTIPALRIALRADLGGTDFRPDLSTSALLGEGIPELARAVREALVPAGLLEARMRWRFHPALPETE